jgi:hypothetical protein
MLTTDTIQFLEDLKANNNLDWFRKQEKIWTFKKDYKQIVADLLAIMSLDSSLRNAWVKNYF